MNHETRALYVTGVFDSFTHTIAEILPSPPKSKGRGDPQPSPAQASLAEFRKHFSGNTWTRMDGAKAAMWLTPEEVARIFGKLDPVIAQLSVSVPALADVPSPIATLPHGTDPDACASFDLYIKLLADYIVQVRFHYWAQYRKSLLPAAMELAQAASCSETLVDEVSVFAARARSASKGNDVVFGALLEEYIRLKVAAAVHPLIVSTGGIGGLNSMSQLDCIIWDRSVAPPIVEIGSVAVVSPIAARAIIEVKSCFDAQLADFAHRMMRLHAEGSVLQDVYAKSFYTQALGIVVWTDHPPARFAATGGTVVVPLYYRDGDTLTPNRLAFQMLQEFLARWAFAAVPPIEAPSAERGHGNQI